ncbi:CHAT domain-containing protein [Streptomyces lunaelactis]|uniref:CHAT domain-containing tetratricopeptide repeat protein n=1 Tax=Streptomyces lunaelactis TaxID=1535768 RepID=UPI0015848215|nr:CHAT domain-containing protein [Streptomyces lunaelactis]NUL06894.1 CHAT domain-containing protein [Streptomyces lunaelactis]
MRVLAAALAADGRHDEAIAWWQKSVAAGDETALRQLSDHLGAAEVERQLRQLAESGDVQAMGNLAKRLQIGGAGERLSEAIEWLTRAATAGAPLRWELVAALDRAGRSAEAEEQLRQLADSGDVQAMRDLAKRLQDGGAGERLSEAIEWLTRAATAGAPLRWELVAALDRAGRSAEAEEQLRQLADSGDVTAVAELVARAAADGRQEVSRKELHRLMRVRGTRHVRRVAEALAHLGRPDEAIQWWEGADTLDARVASSLAARLTERLGRAAQWARDDGVEWQLHEMAVTDDVEAMRVLAGYLARTGRPTGAVEWWTRADAADAARGWGREWAEYALGARSAAGHSASADASPASASPEETAPITPVTSRFLVAQMPSHAALSGPVSLIVRVPTSVSSFDDEVSAPLRGFEPSGEGTPLTVIVQAPAGLVPQGPLEQTIMVASSGDPAPARFSFLARGEGLHRVRVTAWAGGTFLTEIGLEVSVESDGPYEVGSPSAATVGEIRANPGEVTLLVDRVGGQYTFRLLSDRCIYGAVLAQALTANPEVATERAFAMLQRLAAGRGDYTGGHARRWMKETGVGLWIEMVPDLIKEQFWQLRDHITAFSIATEHDVIPWELLYPIAPGRDEGFMVEQFPVLRNSLGQPRSAALPIGEPHYVVSSRVPVNGSSEIESIRRILGSGKIVNTLDDILSVIDAGTTGPLHFTCHNTFDTGGSGSSIALEGGPFVPALLNSAVARRALEGSSPLVFINACRAAGVVPQYTQMLGWAQQFMGAGAGAFVGTLWAVRSDSAQRFAEAFYASLSAGEPLGAAAHQARCHAGHDAADPTWLAYTVYGNPAAVVPTHT